MTVPNSSISELLSLTMQKSTGPIYDSVKNRLALWGGLEDEGGTFMVDGGPTIQFTHAYAENGTFGWYSGGEALNISPSDTHTGSQASWKQCSIAVSFTGLELRQNSGRSQMFNMVKARIDNAKATYRNQMNSAFYGTGTAFGGKALTGLGTLVAVSPTTGSVQGIDRGAAGNFNAWWRNNSVTYATTIGTLSGATILPILNHMALQPAKYDGKVSVWILSDNPYRYMEDALQGLSRLNDTASKYAKMGYEMLVYKGKPCLYEPTTSGITADYIYGLDFDGLGLGIHSDCNFVPLNPTRVSINQDMEVRLLAWQGNMGLKNARKQVVGYNA